GGTIITDEPSPAQDLIGTMVAETLAAIGQDANTQSTTGVTLQPAATDVPTPLPPPSVLHVAYVRNNDAWVWMEGGGPLQLTFVGDVDEVRISSDGEQFAYRRSTGALVHEIWVVNKDGSNNRVLVSQADFLNSYSGLPGDMPPGIGTFQFNWRPGTRQLFYNTRPLFEGPGLGGFDDLLVVNSDTLVKSTFLVAGDGGRFVFSPDGSRLAVVTPTSISLINANGTHLYRDVLTFPSVITYSEYFYYPNPVWSPDSNSLKVIIPPQDPLTDPLLPSSVYSLAVDGSPAVLSGSILAMPFAWPDNAISPNLDRLGFAQPTGDPALNMRDINLANADGSGIVWYMSGEGAQFMGWLPNSMQFVFQVAQGTEKGTHVSSLAEGYFTLSSEPTQIRSIRWVDNTHYLCLRQNGGTTELQYNVLQGAQFVIASGQIWSYDSTE
ncbi:hypothetical protein ACFLXB_09435, partial [Chloroflexota bacterium]